MGDDEWVMMNRLDRGEPINRLARSESAMAHGAAAGSARPDNIFDACRQGDLEAVIFFISQRVDVNVCDFCSWTPLMWACDYDHLEIVKYLLESGADLNVRNTHGLTALDCARQNATSEIILLLLAYDADSSALASLPETKTEASLLACAILEGVLSRQTPDLAKVLESFLPPGR
jgi:ankyrin repeat protein